MPLASRNVVSDTSQILFTSPSLQEKLLLFGKSTYLYSASTVTSETFSPTGTKI